MPRQGAFSVWTVEALQGCFSTDPDSWITGREVLISMENQEKKENSSSVRQSEREQSRRAEMSRRRRKRQLMRRVTFVVSGILFVAAVGSIIWNVAVKKDTPAFVNQGEENITVPRPDIDVQLLTVNPNSRPGIATDRIRGIVVHYTANPGSTAQQNRDYFESLKDSQETSVSSNFVIGLEGEIIQCVPTAEMAYASNNRNSDTVSIECCHPDESGKFTDATYKSLVQLVAWLSQKFGLDTDDIIRHYDVTGKDCPKYFVENVEAWEQFKKDVADYIAKYD